ATVGALAVGLAIVLPNDDAEQADGGSTTRVETDGPTASASLLASDDRIEVDGELTDRGSLGPAAGLTMQLPDAAGAIELDAAQLKSVIEPATGGDPAPGAAQATTTTTAWVEPALPPTSEWVDTGNGVLVPDLLLRIRFCESTNNYQAASAYSTARGAYQFLKGSWDWYGHAATTGVAEAHLATPAQQDQAALATLQAEGTGPWSESRPCWADPDLDPRYITARPASPTPTTAAPESTTTTDASGSTTTPDSTTTTTVTSETSTTAESTTASTASSTTTPESTSSTDTTAPSSTETTPSS
ncbi:MAG: transglycosylase family protein, partial [Actinomycetota bacterium]